jgi:hypothetical protein
MEDLAALLTEMKAENGPPSPKEEAWARAVSACSPRLDGSASGFGRDELQPIAPGILGEEPCCLADLLVIACRNARELEPPLEGLKRGFVREAQRRVRLLRGAKVLLYANVDLLRTALKPRAAPNSQRGRFDQFGQAEQLAEESTRIGLATGRSRDLHVVDALECDVVRGMHAARV